MRATGLRMNGKEMRQRIGMKAIGPMKMKQHGNPKAGMNGKKITTMSMDTTKEKVREERKGKGKGKGKKGHGPQQDQGKGQGDGKGKANYVSPPQCSSQSSMQLAALPSLSNASGLFVTHSSVDLASVKMRESEEQQKEPDLSGCAFLGQEQNPVNKVDEEGLL